MYTEKRKSARPSADAKVTGDGHSFVGVSGVESIQRAVLLQKMEEFGRLANGRRLNRPVYDVGS